MTYEVEIEGAPARLEVRREGGRCVFRLNGGAEQQADALEAEPGVYSILWNGRSYEARVERNASGTIVTVDGRRLEVRISDPRRGRGKGRGGAAAGRQPVAAPMPGKVVRVLVQPGEAVEAGQGLVVVEAMKMQNEMQAPRGGTVAAVLAAEGAAVAAGETLVVIE